MSIEIYMTRACPFCVRARQLLARKGYPFDEIQVDTDPSRRHEMEDRSGRETVPQIFINGAHIGGCDELYALERSGQLDRVIRAG